VLWGDWLKLRPRLVQVSVSGLFTPLIYIAAFGLGLGRTLDAASQPSLGDSYLEFILPGMVALSSMAISFTGTTFSICGDRLFTQTFEELLLLPVHPLALFLGKMIAGVLRGSMTGASVVLVAIVVTGKPWSFLNPLFLGLLIANCGVFAGLGVIAGLKVKSLESVGILSTCLILPMSFLGATFFDPNTLSVALKTLVYCLPLTYTAIGMRAAAYLPLSEFPWYSFPVLLGVGTVVATIGAHLFAHLQD